MNDKMNFLKFFVEPGKYSDTQSLTEKISDFYPAMVFVYNLEEKRLAYVNQKFKDHFNLLFPHVNISEDILEDLVYAEDIEEVRRQLARFDELPEKGTLSFSCRLKDSQRSVRTFRITGSVLGKTLAGTTESLLFVAEDISEHMKAEEELRARCEMVDDTEELLQFGSWTWNPVNDEVTWSDGMFSLFEVDEGSFREELVLPNILQYVLPEHRESFRDFLNEAKTSGREVDVEFCIESPGGNIKTFSSRGKAVYDRDGAVKKVVGVTRDITELKNLQQEQERHVRELNRSNRELEEFAYVASHDLQEPLRKIAMFTERLRTKFGTQLDQEGRLFMDRVLVSADNMRTLIDNLLEFSRANRSSKAFELTDLKSVFDTVAANLELKIEETRAQIMFKDKLPLIEAVPSEMQQLFTNLLANSIKFRREDVEPIVSIFCHKAHRDDKRRFGLKNNLTYFVLTIEDNGIGFESEYSQKIFQIFQRLHGKAEYPGSGIGLAICKRIVQNHNGVVFAEGKSGEGAKFTVILPEKQF